MKRCPHCSRELETQREAETHTTPRRPGGRQLSYERAVRILAWALIDEGVVGAQRTAERTARRWLGRALPARQRHPRKQPADLRKVA